jgi:hypothetical protein
MLKSGIRWLSISALLIMVAGPAHAVVSLEEELKDGKLLTCFVYSMQTIPLLNQLQQQIHKGQTDQDTQQIVSAVGGQEKIPLARIDAEFVLETFAKKVTERHIIQLDEKLLDNQMWKLSNMLYAESVKDKSFKDKFLETFRFTQTCIDEFLH